MPTTRDDKSRKISRVSETRRHSEPSGRRQKTLSGCIAVFPRIRPTSRSTAVPAHKYNEPKCIKRQLDTHARQINMQLYN